MKTEKVVKICLSILLLAALTMVTQTAGIILALVWFTFRRVKVLASLNHTPLYFLFSFIAVYLISVFIVTPYFAKINGRVPLPVVSKNNSLIPVSFLTVLCNRHYVKPKLYQALQEVNKEMSIQYPQFSIGYLDACFPFFNGFPLIPHLSHSDGKKIDLAFVYRDTRTNTLSIARTPTPFGYGSFEPAKKKETDKADQCNKRNVFYNFSQLLGWKVRPHLQIDPIATTMLAKACAANPKIHKIFLEPHLKKRWHLDSFSKIRFQGCWSVRHDDHLHVQL